MSEILRFYGLSGLDKAEECEYYMPYTKQG